MLLFSMTQTCNMGNQTRWPNCNMDGTWQSTYQINEAKVTESVKHRRLTWVQTELMNNTRVVLSSAKRTIAVCHQRQLEDQHPGGVQRGRHQTPLPPLRRHMGKLWGPRANKGRPSHYGILWDAQAPPLPMHTLRTFLQQGNVKTICYSLSLSLVNCYSCLLYLNTSTKVSASLMSQINCTTSYRCHTLIDFWINLFNKMNE